MYSIGLHVCIVWDGLVAGPARPLYWPCLGPHIKKGPKRNFVFNIYSSFLYLFFCLIFYFLFIFTNYMKQVDSLLTRQEKEKKREVSFLF